MKMLLSIGAAAAVALTGAPAAADPHHSRYNNERYDNERHDNGWHHGHHKHHAKYAQGHRFGRQYAYTSYNRLPQTYVRQYNLSPRYRYVYTDGYIYQVDPTNYAVTRILSALTGY